MAYSSTASKTWKVEFGKRMRTARKRVGLTLEAVGKAIGGTKQLVGQQEAGLSIPTPHDLIKISELYDTDLGWLISGQPPKLFRPMNDFPAAVPMVPAKRDLLSLATHLESPPLPNVSGTYVHGLFKQRVFARLREANNAIYAFPAFDSDLRDIHLDDLVFVDLSRRPIAGEACLYALLATQQVLLRRFLPISPHRTAKEVFTLVSDNKLMRHVEIKPELRPVFLGVAVDAYHTPLVEPVAQKSTPPAARVR